MARILIAWEFGQNLGHVGQLLPLASVLRNAGHTVFLALKHDAAALPLLARQGFAYFKAPVVWEAQSEDKRAHALGADRTVESQAEILRLAGWIDAPALARAIRAWRDIICLARPDLLVCQAAPTAQLAARGSGMQVARVGRGFDCPPLSTPFAHFRYWQPVQEQALLTRELELHAQVRNALRLADGADTGRAEASDSESLAALLRPSGDFLCTVPELDHYPGRATLESGPLIQREKRPSAFALAGTGDGVEGFAERERSQKQGAIFTEARLAEGRAFPNAARYYGPLLTQDQGIAPQWPRQNGPRILAYLRPRFVAALDLLRALRKGPWSTLLVVPGWPAADARALASPYLAVATAPVRMVPALQGCTAVITYGGHGTVAGSLLAGKPVLNLPKHTEQLLVSRHAVRTGAGMVVSAEVEGQDMAAAITRLVEEPGYNAAAQLISAKYRHLGNQSTCAAVAAGLETLLQGTPSR